MERHHSSSNSHVSGRVIRVSIILLLSQHSKYNITGKAELAYICQLN